MDKNSKLFVIGGITISAVAGAYVFWGPNMRYKRKKKDWVPGLDNFGNSCFMNAVLQGLASCSTFIKWLDSTQHSCHVTGSLVTALRNILKRLNNDDGIYVTEPNDVYSPVEVLRALTSSRWIISNREQDAHELFHVVTTTLEEEIKMCTSVVSLLDVKEIEKPSVDSGVMSRPHFHVASGSLPTYNCPTRGFLASRLTCRTCGYKKPLRVDSFDSISLSIPDHWGTFRLEDFLKEWGSSELVDNVICDGCTQLKKRSLESLPSLPCKSTFVKQLSIVKLPKCLCLHVLRTVWLNSGTVSKRYDIVSFPEFLFMDDYLLLKKQRRGIQECSRLLGGGKGDYADRYDRKLPCHAAYESACSATSVMVKEESAKSLLSLLKKGEHMYQLKAVLVHSGDTDCGHFITFRRGPYNSTNCNKWFCASDTVVMEVSLSEVMKANPYMLLYEYVSTKKPTVA